MGNFTMIEKNRYFFNLRGKRAGSLTLSVAHGSGKKSPEKERTQEGRTYSVLYAVVPFGSS